MSSNKGPKTRPTIFIVDDDRGLVRLIAKALVREGFAAPSSDSGSGAIAWLNGNRADLMLLDLQLQDIEGRALVEQLAREGRCPPFIIITGQGDERVAVEMMKRGARDYLVKDVDFLQFVPAVVKRALEQLDQERRLAEAEEQVHLVRSVVEKGFSAVLITDAALPDPRVVYINPSFATATGYAPEAVIGRPLSALHRLSRLHQRLREGLPSGADSIDEISAYETATGERWGEWRVGPVRDRGGKESHWLIIFRDITERRRLEREILEISDQERRRIGQDLHDGLCQHLVGIELMSQVLEQKLARRSKSDAAKAGEIARHVRSAISQTRSLARGLAPVTLESEGLTSALRELATNTESMFGVACRVEASEIVPVQVAATGTHLYRIAQEAVSNAIKHGKAGRVTIELSSNPHGVILRVFDNGRGFAQPPNSHRGMGLRIMQYRAGMLGATLTFQQATAGGTVVSCSAPASTPPGSVGPLRNEKEP